MADTFVIVTDMTADLPEGWLAERNIDFASMPYTIDGKEYGRTNTLSYEEFYQQLRMGAMPTTSQTDVYDAEQIWLKHLENGQNILHLCFSSGMSGSFDSLQNLRKELLKKFPDRKIYVVDTLGGAGGEGLAVYYAAKQKEEGKNIEEIYEWLEENKLGFHHFFIVEDLNYLCRGGRLSKVEALIGTALRIRPILHLNVQGKIAPVLKAIGTKKAISAMLELTEKNIIKEQNDFILISHGGDLSAAKNFGEKVAERFPGIRLEYCNVNYLVGSHAGAGSLAIFFFGTKRKRIIDAILDD